MNPTYLQIIVYIASIALAIFGISAVFRKQEKFGPFNKFLIGLPLLVVGGLLFINQIGILESYGVNPIGKLAIVQAPAQPGQPVAPLLAGGICAVEDTTVTLSTSDKYLATATGGNHRYRINGAPALTVADAGTLTASPGNSLEILWTNASLTGYFPKTDTFSVPCQGTITYSADLGRNGTITITFFNDPNGDAISSDGSTNVNQTLTNGDIKNVKMNVQGTYQRDVPYGYITVVEFNKTVIDDVVVSSTSGIEQSSAPIPQTHATTFGTESGRKAYEFPASISNAVNSYVVMLDADDTNDPTRTLGDIKFSFFPKSYHIDDKDGGKFKGPSAEDEYNAVTRTGQFSATIYVD